MNHAIWRSSLIEFAFVVAILTTSFSTPAAGAAPQEPPWVECTAGAESNLLVVEHYLSRVDGTTVHVGTPLTLSSPTTAPLTFAIASTQGALAHPDIDGGQGVPEPDPESISDVADTFVSRKATASARTVYLQASFLDTGIHPCPGVEPVSYTTAPYSVIVLPAEFHATAPVLQLRLSAPWRLPKEDQAIAYRLECTTACTGASHYQALAVPRTGKPRRVPLLDFGPRPVAIESEGGGREEFRRRYRGAALRLLRRLLAAGDRLEIRISASVNNASGAEAHTRRSARFG